MTKLTIVYLTNRMEPHFEWFASSLKSQLREGEEASMRLVIVDFHANTPSRHDRISVLVPDGLEYIHVPPKPCVWQGPGRLTSKDYFAAANARNTGLCLAPDGWIAYVDDLSVLMPAWLARVREAMATNRFILGAYRKVKRMFVQNGTVANYQKTGSALDGLDSRFKYGDDKPVPAPESWFFGCSLVGPVQAFLDINGWEEDCDGMGFEDCITGMHMARSGVKLWYDRRMLTYEDEDLHSQPDGVLPRLNVRYDGGAYPDAAYRILEESRMGLRKESATYPCPITEMRQRVLAGEPFPATSSPQICWQNGRPLSEL